MLRYTFLLLAKRSCSCRSHSCLEIYCLSHHNLLVRLLQGNGHRRRKFLPAKTQKIPLSRCAYMSNSLKTSVQSLNFDAPEIVWILFVYCGDTKKVLWSWVRLWLDHSIHEPVSQTSNNCHPINHREFLDSLQTEQFCTMSVYVVQ